MLRRLALHDRFHAYRIDELREKRDWSEVPLAAAAALAGLGASLQPGELEVIGPVEVPGLAPRRIRIYLPKGSAAGSPRLALYLFDGQNMFDDGPSFSGGWHVHETLEHVARRREPGGAAAARSGGDRPRQREAHPRAVAVPATAASRGCSTCSSAGSPAPSCLLLRQELGIVDGPVGAVVGGSSMGGLASFYAHFHYPRPSVARSSCPPRYGSPSTPCSSGSRRSRRPRCRASTSTAGRARGAARCLPLVAQLAAQLTERGYDADRLMWRPDPRGGHNEASWRRRLPKAVRFMYR